MDCGHPNPESRMFCPTCGHVTDRNALRSVADRMLGPVGIKNSTSPKIDEFLNTGDPNVFARK